MWAPNSILTTYSFDNLHESSPLAGEKCPITSLTEMQHGNPIPLSNFLDFLLLKTFNNSASMNVSTSPQTVDTSAPSTQREMALSRAAIKKKNEINLLKDRKVKKHFVIDFDHMMFKIL
jgi:hypothetical protein